MSLVRMLSSANTIEISDIQQRWKLSLRQATVTMLHPSKMQDRWMEFSVGKPNSVIRHRHWGKLLGDSAAVTAMLDRLLHHGHLVKCGPRSWRTKTDAPEH